MSSLQQMNVSFDPTEDRLLWRLTSQTEQGLCEFRLWMTRRMVRLLWGGLDQLLSQDPEKILRVEPAARQAVRQFEEQAALEQADFKTPFRAQDAALPLGETPLLVSQIKLNHAADGNKIMALHDKNNQGITLTLSPTMVHSLRKLLVESAQKAQWDLHLQVADLKSAFIPADLPMQ
ncbi:MAG: hypothetical protein QMD09_04530 [Desulfatibacillaceae bacterium]|nr:hypothetical protein [Desulfatibacillaceae bacterium]